MDRAIRARRSVAHRHGAPMPRLMAIGGFLGALLAQAALLAGSGALLTGAAPLRPETILGGGGVGLLLMALARRAARPEADAENVAAAREAPAAPHRSAA